MLLWFSSFWTHGSWISTKFTEFVLACFKIDCMKFVDFQQLCCANLRFWKFCIICWLIFSLSIENISGFWSWCFYCFTNMIVCFMIIMTITVFCWNVYICLCFVAHIAFVCFCFMIFEINSAFRCVFADHVVMIKLLTFCALHENFKMEFNDVYTACIHVQFIQCNVLFGLKAYQQAYNGPWRP